MVAKRRTSRIRCLIAVAVTLATAACTRVHPAPSPPSPTASTPSDGVRRAVQRWRHDGGSAQVDRLAADFATMGRQPTAPDWQVAVNCRRLQIDVAGAQSFAAIPDRTAERMWSTALDAYARGAADCTRGADAHNYGLIVQASTEFDSGTVIIDRLNVRLNDLTS